MLLKWLVAWKLTNMNNYLSKHPPPPNAPPPPPPLTISSDNNRLSTVRPNLVYQAKSCTTKVENVIQKFAQITKSESELGYRTTFIFVYF